MGIVKQRRVGIIVVLLDFVLCTMWATFSDASDAVFTSSEIAYDFFDMDFLDRNTGWICGASGFLFETQDGGVSWRKIETGVDDSIFGVVFHDPDHGVLVGQTGVLMITSDAGHTWQKIQMPPDRIILRDDMEVPADKTLLTMDFYNDKTGMAAGDWGKIIVTHDGGKSWQDVSLPEDLLLYDLKYTGPSEIWIAAEMGNLIHSMDGGHTWEKMQMAYGTLFGIDMDEKGNGIAVGMEGTVLCTKDKWKTWEKSQITRESLYSVRINGEMALAIGDAGSIFVNNIRQESAWHQIEVPSELTANWLQCNESLPGDRYIIAGARGSIHLVEREKLMVPGKGQ